MKKILSILFAVLIFLNCNVLALAVVNVPDVFGNEYVDFDVNADSKFDIRDLVRAKKYVSGMSVTVNLNFAQNGSADAEMLVQIRQQLLKDGGV